MGSHPETAAAVRVSAVRVSAVGVSFRGSGQDPKRILPLCHCRRDVYGGQIHHAAAGTVLVWGRVLRLEPR
jgi:hypothetical protein